MFFQQAERRCPPPPVALARDGFDRLERRRSEKGRDPPMGHGPWYGLDSGATRGGGSRGNESVARSAALRSIHLRLSGCGANAAASGIGSQVARIPSNPSIKSINAQPLQKQSPVSRWSAASLHLVACLDPKTFWILTL